MGENGYATHSVHHSAHQKDQSPNLQCYGDSDGIIWCEQTFMVLFTMDVKKIKDAAHKNVDIGYRCKQRLTQTLRVNRPLTLLPSPPCSPSRYLYM